MIQPQSVLAPLRLHLPKRELRRLQWSGESTNVSTCMQTAAIALKSVFLFGLREGNQFGGAISEGEESDSPTLQLRWPTRSLQAIRRRRSAALSASGLGAADTKWAKC
jgi:hypothetical protein